MCQYYFVVVIFDNKGYLDTLLDKYKGTISNRKFVPNSLCGSVMADIHYNSEHNKQSERSQQLTGTLCIALNTKTAGII